MGHNTWDKVGGSLMSALEQSTFFPRLLSHKQMLSPTGARVRPPKFKLKPIDSSMWNLSSPVNWDSRTPREVNWGDEVGNAFDLGSSKLPWFAPKYLRLPEVAPTGALAKNFNIRCREVSPPPLGDLYCIGKVEASSVLKDL